MPRIVIYLLIVCLNLCAFGSDEDQLVLYVKAKKSLPSLYLSEVITTHPQFSPSYLEGLYQVIRDDFLHNGRSDLKRTDPSIDKILRSQPHEICHQLPARHTVKFELDHNIWKTTLFTPNVKLGQRIKDIHLSGDLQSDVEKMHQLADKLHLRIYNCPGIASKKILYEYRDDNLPEHSEIMCKFFDRFDGHRITTEKTLCLNPIWIPQTNHLIYVCYKTGQPKLYISSTNKNQGKPLIYFRGNQLLPSISPLGNFIAFISDANGRQDVFIQQLSYNHEPMGKPQQIYSHKTAVQSSSSFSPDSSQLAFVSDQTGTPRVYLLNLTEVLKTRRIPKIECITHLNRENTSPSWSPDGTKIAYSAKTDGVRQIWIYDLYTQKEMQLTTGPEHKENPCWAPNSLHIVYNTTSPTYDLFVVNLNQLTPVQITHGPGIKHFPYWEQSHK